MSIFSLGKVARMAKEAEAAKALETTAKAIPEAARLGKRVEAKPLSEISDNYIQPVKAPEPVFIKDLPTGGDYAFHGGDLGFGTDTSLGHMSGGRGSGHYGTGVYFASNVEALGGRSSTRPVAAIDFSKYKLMKIKSHKQGLDIHDALRLINGLVDERMHSNFSWIETDPFKVKLYKELKMPLDSAQAKTANEAAFKIWLTDMRKEDRSMYSKEDLVKAIKKAVDSAAKKKKKVNHTSIYEETASTQVMKWLGWEGIDVRAVPELDNTRYGSVVYRKTLAEEGVPIKLEDKKQ